MGRRWCGHTGSTLWVVGWMKAKSRIFISASALCKISIWFLVISPPIKTNLKVIRTTITPLGANWARESCYLFLLKITVCLLKGFTAEFLDKTNAGHKLTHKYPTEVLPIKQTGEQIKETDVEQRGRKVAEPVCVGVWGSEDHSENVSAD